MLTLSPLRLQDSTSVRAYALFCQVRGGLEVPSEVEGNVTLLSSNLRPLGIRYELLFFHVKQRFLLQVNDPQVFELWSPGPRNEIDKS